MLTTRNSKPVRVLVHCDKESIERLKVLKSLWPRIIAAHQANIVNEALDHAMSKPPAKNGFSLRITFDSTSLDRFIALAKNWGNLTPAQQQRCVDVAESVV